MTAPLTIKLGGIAGAHADGLAVLVEAAAPDWVVVHGGGNEVAAWSNRLGLTTHTIDGLRVTDDATLEVVAAVLRGLVNARLVARFAAGGKRAIGISGVDGLFSIEPRDATLGAVASVDRVDTDLLDTFRRGGLVPVVAPLGCDAAGNLYNVNADEVAGAIAAARGGRLLLLTDVDAVQRSGTALAALDVEEAARMLDDGSASGGMRPKLRAAIKAANAGCDVQIVDGRSAAAVRAALAEEPAGTHISGRAGTPSIAGGTR